jgi:hypothetical protein
LLVKEFQPDLKKIAQYERKPLAQRYAKLLHSIAGRECELLTRESEPTGKEE